MKIIIAVNGGPSSENIVQYGADLADSANGKIFLVTMTRPYMKAQIKIGLNHEQRRLSNFPPDTIQLKSVIRVGRSIRGIGQLAAELDADHIVMGGQSRSFFNDLFQRSFASRLLNRCNRPVLIAPGGTPGYLIAPAVLSAEPKKTFLVEYGRSV